MTRTEWAKAAAYLTAGTGKSLTAEQLEVYYDCLGDLSYNVLQVAAKRVLMEHKWATFPSVAELRQAAAETQAGEVAALAPAEMWEVAWRIVGATDPEVPGSFERASRGAPAVVLAAIRAFGLSSLCYGDEPLSVVRGQFLRIAEQLAAREKRVALMPTALKAQIGAAKLNPAITPTPTKAIAAIGGAP